jgi:O-antigen/teichoic acid export membrane protein
MSSLKLVKNAFANLCRGGSSALVALVLPPFLTKILPADSYGTWLLVLQLCTYVGFLDFGIQTAVGRYVAYYNELGNIEKRNSVVSTSFAILGVLGVVAVVGIAILSWQLPYLFKGMPNALQGKAQMALLIVGGSLALSLPCNVFGGVFVGIQRYDVPAWIVGSNKFLGGLFTVLVAYFSHDIVAMSLVIATTNVLSGFWHYFACQKIAHDVKISVNRVSRVVASEVFSYCFSLSIWAIAMLLISGLDTAIIGYFDYSSVVYYSLAASLTLFMVGIQNSILAGVMPHAAEIAARQEKESLGALLVSTTRYAVVIMLFTSLPLVLASKWLLTLWVGDLYASKTTLLLQLLVVGSFVRQIGAPYSSISVAVGEQKQIILSPLVEGLVNLIISMVAAYFIGSVGVAIGTVCGGVASVLMHFLYNLPRSNMIVLKDKLVLIQAVIKPLRSVLPALIFLGIQGHLQFLESVVLFLLSTSLSFTILWRDGLLSSEKNRVYAKLKEKSGLFRP